MRIKTLKADKHFGQLGWRHELWQYVRLFNSILTRNQQREELLTYGTFGSHVVPDHLLELLRSYIAYRDRALHYAASCLRTEEEANQFCDDHGIRVGVTSTQSKDHHQSTKPVVATVRHISERIAKEYDLDVDSNPQRSCFWTNYDHPTVTARNLYGAIPGIENPVVVREIKEYWGKTRGGSKMSDAVYECMLVGMELRLMEEKTKEWIAHACIIDGKHQWGHRLSDL